MYFCMYLVVGRRHARAVVADLDGLHAPVLQAHLHLQCVVLGYVFDS